MQRDVFFAVSRGRLKLRYVDSRGELIAYQRDDVAHVHESDYRILTTSEPQVLEEVLRRALTVIETVDKRRHLLEHRHTRIHLDDVAGLGRFVELETVADEIQIEDALQEHADLVALLGLEISERVAVGYVDLLAGERQGH